MSPTTRWIAEWKRGRALSRSLNLAVSSGLAKKNVAKKKSTTSAAKSSTRVRSSHAPSPTGERSPVVPLTINLEVAGTVAPPQKTPQRKKLRKRPQIRVDTNGSPAKDAIAQQCRLTSAAVTTGKMKIIECPDEEGTAYQTASVLERKEGDGETWFQCTRCEMFSMQKAAGVERCVNQDCSLATKASPATRHRKQETRQTINTTQVTHELQVQGDMFAFPHAEWAQSTVDRAAVASVSSTPPPEALLAVQKGGKGRIRFESSVRCQEDKRSLA